MQRCTSSRRCISSFECEGCIKYAPQFHRVCSQLTDAEPSYVTNENLGIGARYNNDINSKNSDSIGSSVDVDVDFADIRATFALDQILYRDPAVEVNPGGLYFVHTKKWLDIMDITGIVVKLRAKTPLLKPTILQRLSPNPKVRARIPASVVVPNVFLRVRNMRTVAFCVERPLEVKQAVVHARNIVY